MAFNLPVSASNGQREALFNKTYQYTASFPAWELDQITASRLENMLDVNDVGLIRGYGLRYDAGTGKWQGATKPITGLTKTALSSASIANNFSESIFEVNKSDATSVSFEIEPSVYLLPDPTGSNRRFFTGSSEILIVSVSNADVAGNAIEAASASLFENDQWSKYLNFNPKTDLLSVTMSDDTTYYSASLSIFSTVDTVNGRYADSAGNINLSLIETITGPNAARPPSAGDGVSYVVVDDPDPNINGTTYVYDLDNTNWVNITPTSFDADDRVFVKTAGDSMQGRLYLNQPISGSDMATFDYINSFSSSLNVNQGLQGFNYYKSANQTIVGSTAGTYRVLTWDVEEFNETSGSMAASGIYTVGPDTKQMIFDAGCVLSANNTLGRRFRIVRNGTETLAATSGRGTVDNQHASQVHSGLVKVEPGDTIQVEMLSAPTVDALGGQNVATFFRGYIAQPPEPLGVQFVSVGSGLSGGGSVDPVTMSVNENIARTGSNTFSGRLNLTGSFTTTGDITLRALQVNATASITGSTTFRGTVVAQGLGEYVSDVEAAANGIPINGLYRNGNRVLIRHT